MDKKFNPAKWLDADSLLKEEKQQEEQDPREIHLNSCSKCGGRAFIDCGGEFGFYVECENFPCTNKTSDYGYEKEVEEVWNKANPNV